MDTASPSPCPREDLLELLVRGGDAGPELLAHVAACLRCSQYVSDARENDAFLRDIGPLMPCRAPPLEDSVPACETVPGYQILEELRRGGQGIVYKAVQIFANRTVAIKTLLRGPFATVKQCLRFEREAETIAALRHPHIVTIYDSGVTPEGRPYFAMEYVEGIPLNEWNPQSTVHDQLALFAKICAAVSYAHQRGIVHRDLKPANILVDSAGEPHILDFGLAKLTDDAGSSHLQTVTGEFMGTPAYASPEQVSGQPDQIDVRTDVYTLGVILYEMLTGEFPYPVSTPVSEVLLNIARQEPRRPGLVNPLLDDEIDAILLTALAKLRQRRYQSAAALCDDVQHYLAGRPITAKRDSTWYILKKTARRYRVHVGLAAVAMMLLALLAVVMTVQSYRLARQRDRAVVAETLAGSRARELAESLSDARIERGRMLATVGNIPAAEELIWREFLCPPDGQVVSAEVASGGHPLAPAAAHAYWALWETYSHCSCLATWSGHSADVGSVSFSPAGDLVASAGDDGAVILWPVSSDENPKRIRCSSKPVEEVVFSPDGCQLLVRDQDGVLTLWDVASKMVTHTFDVRARSACFSADGLMLATGDVQGTVRLWQLASRSCVATIGRRPEAVTSICFGPEHHTLAWSSERSVMYWDGHSIQDTQVPIADWSSHVKFMPEYVVFAHYWAAWRWEAPFVDPPTVWFTGGTGAINSLDISRDGSLLAVGGNDRLIRIWDTTTGQCLQTLSGHTGGVSSINFSRDGALLVSGSVDDTVRLWEVASSANVQVLSGHADTVHSICLSPDGQSLVSSGAGETTVRFWNVRSSQQSAQLQTGHTDVIAAVSFSPDGRLLATASYDHTVKLWDAETLRNLHAPMEHSDKANTVSFSPDGSTLASAGLDRTIKLWDVRTGACRECLVGHQDRIPQICFSPDGRTLASCSVDQTLILWDTDTRRSRLVLAGHDGAVRAVAFSPIGNILASGSDDAMIKLWDCSSGTCLATLASSYQDVFDLAFSPDGRLLASSARDGQISIWDVASRRNVLDLQQRNLQAVFSLCFSADGQTLISAGGDKLIHLWDLNYFQRHIAGNLECNLTRFEAEMSARHLGQDPLRAWGRAILSRHPLAGN